MELAAMERRTSDGSGSDGSASKWWNWQRWIGEQVIDQEALKVVVVEEEEEVVVVVVVVALVAVVEA